MKNNGCVGCHQLGQLSTRTIPAGASASSPVVGEAWMRRVQSGQAGQLMVEHRWPASSAARRSSTSRDWTDRVAKGELPQAKPARPQGVERNIVVTTWDWGDPKQYLHDLIASDRRNPTVNAYGPLFGSPEYCDRHPADPRSQDEQRRRTSRRRCATRTCPKCLGPGHAAMRQAAGAVALLGRGEASGTPGSTTTTRCSTRRAGSGWRRRCAARRTRPSARRAPTIPRPSCSRWSRRTGSWRCSIRRR